MVGIAEVSAAMASLQAGRDILTAMVGIRDGAKLAELRVNLNQIILDAQQGLFAAQQEHAAATKRIADLEQELVRLSDWETEKERYRLQKAGPIALVYAPKSGMENGEPLHWLCVNCVGDGKKSILQPVNPTVYGSYEWSCNRCKQIIASDAECEPENPGGVR